MTEPILPPLKPIPIKDRVSVLFLEKGNVDILDGVFVVVGKNGIRRSVGMRPMAQMKAHGRSRPKKPRSRPMTGPMSP